MQMQVFPYSWRWAALVQENDEREGGRKTHSGNTAETGEETFANSAARTAGPPAHRDERPFHF